MAATAPSRAIPKTLVGQKALVTGANSGIGRAVALFCPCHGSRFDLAGRVFDGSPASLNLVIPSYDFPSQNELVVGRDEG